MEHPYQVLPPLSPEEYARLKADIAQRGVQVPIEYDEEGHLLDGVHREQACRELGLDDWPRVIRCGLTEAQKHEHALTLNLARRHLRREDKMALAIKLRQDGWTQERVAQTLCVSQGTVSMWLNEFINANKLPASTAIQGKDGKRYPARKARRSTRQGTRTTNQTAAMTQPPAFTPSESISPGHASEMGEQAPGLPPAQEPPMVPDEEPQGPLPYTAVHRPGAPESAAMPERVSPRPQARDSAVDPLETLVEAFYTQLRRLAEREGLVRLSHQWSGPAKADFLVKVTYVISQLQALQLAFEQEGGQDELTPNAGTLDRNAGQLCGESTMDSMAGGEEVHERQDDDADTEPQHGETAVPFLSEEEDQRHNDSHPESPTIQQDGALHSDERLKEAVWQREREALKRIEIFKAQGFSDRATARQLNAEGVPTTSGDGQWNHQKIARLRQAAVGNGHSTE